MLSHSNRVAQTCCQACETNPKWTNTVYQVRQSNEGKFVRRQHSQKGRKDFKSALSSLVSAVRSDPYQQETVLPSLDIAHCIFVSAPRISSNWDDMTFSPQTAARAATCNYPKVASGSSCICTCPASSNSARRLMSREQPALGILVLGVGIELETMASAEVRPFNSALTLTARPAASYLG